MFVYVSLSLHYHVSDFLSRYFAAVIDDIAYRFFFYWWAYANFEDLFWLILEFH
jgi:hypothetical protein